VFNKSNEAEAERLADSVDGAARRMGVSRGSLYKLAKAGKLQMTRLAGRTLILRAEQDRVLREATAGGRIA